MKKLILTGFGIFLISGYSFSQLNLDIEITGIKNDVGKIMLQLLDGKEVTVNQAMGDIKDGKSTISIRDLKPGKYAIRYFHDENSNGKLDTNTFGIPKEGYGFSNNAKGSFGPPAFEKWIFDLTENKKLALKINN
jgi:uncharacterized protein (DUF2141 family)